MTYGWPLPKRVELIQKLRKGGSKVFHTLKFQGKHQPFEVYRVPIEMPKYRLENGRTQAAQEDYLAQHRDRSADFFTRDKELAEAQAIQHKILKSMLDVKDTHLLTYFKKNKQDEPLVLSNLGFVVNGNRRLCAMRELLDADGKRFGHFKHIDVIVLPDCDSKDIDELEAELQIKKDIKAEYTWIAMACMLRKRQTEFSETQLAHMYDMKPKDVRRYLDILADVDNYLKEIGKPKQYTLVQDNYYAFERMRSERQRIKDLGEREVFQRAAHIAIQNPEGQGRLYERIPQIREHLHEIIQQLDTELNTKTVSSKSKREKRNLLGGKSNPLLGLVGAMTTESNKKKVIEVITEVIESETVKKRELKKNNYTASQIVKANTALKEAYNSLNGKSITIGIEDQLDSIEETIQNIRNWLKKHA